MGMAKGMRDVLEEARKRFNDSAAIAEKVHDVILRHGGRLDKAVVDQYIEELEYFANARQGAPIQRAEGESVVDVSSFLRQEIIRAVGSKKLAGCEYLHDNGGTMSVGLMELAEALPIQVLARYFEFDPEKRMKEAGFDFEPCKKALKDAFRGTVGTPGQDDFGLVMDTDVLNKTPGIGVIILGFMPFFHGKDSEGRDLDPEKTALVTADRNPYGMRVLAQILNFQGASHYLPKEVGK